MGNLLSVRGGRGLASPVRSNTNNFVNVNDDGTVNNNNATNSNGVALGLCEW